MHSIINKPFIIAEVGLNHMGNFQTAKNYINSFSAAGVDAIKFQVHLAEFESSNQEKFRIMFSKKYKNRFDYWKKTSFSKPQWKNLYNYAKKKKIFFGVSIFTEEALDLFDNGKYFDFIKIPSGETSTISLLKRISKLNKTTIISTGLSNWEEIQNLTKIFKNKTKNSFLQCTSKYPTNLNEIGFNIIDEIKNKHNYKCGLSDHSGNISTALYAIFKKIDFIEFHVKLNDKGNFPDKEISMSLKNTKLLTKIRKDFLELEKPIDKDDIFKTLLDTKKLFGKSLALNKDVPKNYLIKYNDITLKKPGNGIQPTKIKEIVNKKVKTNLSKKNILSYNDFY